VSFDGDGRPGVELLVCVTCKREVPVLDDDQRPGAILHGELSARDMPEGVTLRPVECLSNCNSGCSVVLRGGPGRWTYVYGHLREGRDADLILEGAAKYAATADGLVPWRERSEHFRKNCIARIPPLEG